MTTHTQSNTFVDPVCGMSVDPATAAAKTCYDGVEIYFCAQGCKQAFEAHPKKYTGSKKKGFWKRYLDRLDKVTNGKPPACCH